MRRNPVRRLLWLSLPAVSSPVGGGLIKLGHGSTWAAVSVAVAPYVVCALLYATFIVGYLAAVLRYVCSGADGQQAMERLITVSANAVVSILTLEPGARAAEQPRKELSSPRSPR
ncbi:MAG TPA: hypothetical protein VGG16_09260 [Streptosporangiaceae bacterium]